MVVTKAIETGVKKVKLLNILVLLGLVGFTAYLIYDHVKFEQRHKRWKKENERFLNLMENCLLVANSDMDEDEKEQAVMYLYENYQQAEKEWV